MAYVDWRLKGPEVAACNCSWGCPCQFNGLPTLGVRIRVPPSGKRNSEKAEVLRLKG